MRASPAALALALAIVVPLQWGCSGHVVPDVLWLPPSASVIARTGVAAPIAYEDGSVGVLFTIPYPNTRDQLTSQLTCHFADRGWHQRATQYMNRRLPTSFHAGWRMSCGCILSFDPDGRPAQREVHLWEGEWQNASGDVITYRLTASRNWRYPMENLVHGHAAFTPATIVGRAGSRR